LEEPVKEHKKITDLRETIEKYIKENIKKYWQGFTIVLL
jgi:hypothetical protein